jgi:hypothetical protein
LTADSRLRFRLCDGPLVNPLDVQKPHGAIDRSFKTHLSPGFGPQLIAGANVEAVPRVTYMMSEKRMVTVSNRSQKLRPRSTKGSVLTGSMLCTAPACDG